MSTQPEKVAKKANVLTFFADVIGEGKRVVWPTPEDTKQATVTVLIMVILLGLFLGAIDFGASNLMEFLSSRGFY